MFSYIFQAGGETTFILNFHQVILDYSGDKNYLKNHENSSCQDRSKF